MKDQKPRPWSEYRETVPYNWLKPFYALEHGGELLAFWLSGSGIIASVEYLGKLSVLVVVVMWLIAAEDRQKDAERQAWLVVNSVAGQGGDGGRREALEDLVAWGVSLNGVNLKRANLAVVNLAGAYLADANLFEANLLGAILNDAYLSEADLSGAQLGGAQLSGAVLTGAKLIGANLVATNLTEANLSGADLSGAGILTTIMNGCLFDDKTVWPDGFDRSQLATCLDTTLTQGATRVSDFLRLTGEAEESQ